MSENGHPDRWLRPSSVMRRLEISRATLMRCLRAGKVVAKRLPGPHGAKWGHMRVSEASILAYAAETGKTVALNDPYPRSGVYFLHCGTFIKIGYAKEIKTRTTQLLLSLPFEASVLGGIRADDPKQAKHLEQALHRRFASLRHHGEWFHDHPTIRACISELW